MNLDGSIVVVIVVVGAVVVEVVMSTLFLVEFGNPPSPIFTAELPLVPLGVVVPLSPVPILTPLSPRVTVPSGRPANTGVISKDTNHQADFIIRSH